jgi:anti-sigma regulatory factor (Ser/Thr protein kinase)
VIAAGREEVRLTLPAVPEYARIVRLTAAGLASRLGFTYDEVEDLRIAVGEACSHLLGNDGHDGTLGVTYLLEPDRITIEAVGEFTDAADGAVQALSEQILDAVVDSHKLEPRRVVLVKHRSS